MRCCKQRRRRGGNECGRRCAADASLGLDCLTVIDADELLRGRGDRHANCRRVAASAAQCITPGRPCLRARVAVCRCHFVSPFYSSAPSRPRRLNLQRGAHLFFGADPLFVPLPASAALDPSSQFHIRPSSPFSPCSVLRLSMHFSGWRPRDEFRACGRRSTSRTLRRAWTSIENDVHMAAPCKNGR